MARGAIDAVTEPLLPAVQPSDGRSSSGISGGTGRSSSPGCFSPQGAIPQADSDLHIVRHIQTLLSLLRPYPALILALLAVAEAVVVAEVGKVPGSFYLIVVDGQPSKFAAAMLRAAALYAASTTLYAAASWVTETLALSWRQRLTHHLHRCYCQHQHAYFFLQQQPAGQKQPQPQQCAKQERQSRQQQEDRQQRQQEQQWHVDNPDQRIVSDAAELCECLSAVARVAAAAPFKLLYYSWLANGYLGWRGLAAVYAFFWLAGMVQWLAVTPVACLVFRQERREGDLRFAHLRLREYAAEVAQYHGAEAERTHLDATLGAALANQRLLVHWRAALAGITRAVDYAGAMLNYLVVGAAVFAGVVGGVGDSGQLAQFVSNASFATLTLIYTFTEVLDLSDKLSRLGGLTARVGQLLDALPGGGSSSGDRCDGTCAAASRGDTWHDLHAVRLSMDGRRELQPPHFATLLQPPRLFSCLGGTVEMEASTHRLGPDLQREAAAIFPDAPAGGGQLLACVTFQFAGGGVSLAPDSSIATLGLVAAEMDRLLERFLRWEAAVRQVAGAVLASRGYWCDAVDPRSGTALHGTRGARWSEVAAAHALLCYERQDTGICPVVLHPRHGSSAYPVTLFTDAPPGELERALAAVCDAALPPPRVPAGGDGGSTAAAPLLSLQHVSVRTPAGALAVAGLNLDLSPGQHLLIAGPNGCGKSTLVKALCRLHPLAAGHVLLVAAGPQPPGHGVMFVPQRPLAAPGAALWQQICYPGSGEPCNSSAKGQQQQQQQQEQEQQQPSERELLALVEQVGLRYLLDRVGGSFQAAADWGAQLSPGELQRLAVARVLYRCPSLAILDEPTSAVSEEAAAQLYGQLQVAGITCISIGQDSEHLRRLHRQLLQLGCGPPEGAWQLRQLG